MSLVEVSSDNFVGLKVGDALIDKRGIEFKVEEVLGSNHDYLAVVKVVDPNGQETIVYFHHFLGPTNELGQPFMKFADPLAKIRKS